MQENQKTHMRNYKTDTDAFDRITRRATPIQRALLRELRDRYLRAEGPLTEEDFTDLGGMQNQDVRAVRNTYFTQDGSVFRCEAFDAEIEAHKATTEARKRAGKARWNRGKRAHAEHMQSTCSAHAEHMLSLAQPCGSDGHSQTLGGDYRGGKEKKKNKTLLSSSFKTPPKRPPLGDAPAWLASVCLWFGRAQGDFSPAEQAAAEQVEVDHRPKPADIAILGRYYSAAFPAGRDFRRRSLGALLANWSTELDRARLHARTAKRQEGVL